MTKNEKWEGSPLRKKITSKGPPYTFKIPNFKSVGGTLWRNFFSKGGPFSKVKKCKNIVFQKHENGYILRIYFRFFICTEAFDGCVASKSSVPFFSPLLEVYFFRPPSWFTLRDEPATTAYKNTLPKVSKKLAQENFSQIVLSFLSKCCFFCHYKMWINNKKGKTIWEKFSCASFFDTFGSVFL